MKREYIVPIDFIGDIPPDNEEIVRCKDCKHWDIGHSEECDNSDSVCFHNGWCKPDWFCADGEREPTQTNAKNNALDVR